MTAPHDRLKAFRGLTSGPRWDDNAGEAAAG